MAARWSVETAAVVPDIAPAARARLLQGERVLLAALVVVECIVLFARLDNAYLSIGEGNTAALGQNVLKYGYPRVWDGTNVVFPLYGGDVDSHLAWVGHPWLQYYLAAGGIFIFGPTNLGARFVFGACGVLAVIALYFLALRLSGNRYLAALSAIILAVHPLFWFYSRQSRYYAPTMLLMILAMYYYLKWQEQPSAARLGLFVISAVLLFYSLYTIWAFVMLAVGVHYLMASRKRRSLAQFALAVLTIGALTLPFFIYAPPHFHLDRQPTSDGYSVRLLVHLWKIQTLYYPLATLAIAVGLAELIRRVAKARRVAQATRVGQATRVAHASRVAPAKNGDGMRMGGDYLILIGVPAYVCFVVIYPFFTTHYMLPVLPVGAILVAWLVLKLREYSRWAAAVILPIVLATNVLNILPYMATDKLGITPSKVEPAIANPTWTHTPGTPLAHYLTEQLAVHFYAFDFLDFLAHDYRHELKSVTTFIRQNAAPSDAIYAPWNDADAIAFYTGRRVKYHTEPSLFPDETIRTLLPKDDEADWIDPLSIDVPGRYYMSERFYSDYERVRIDAPKEYFETYPNMDFFDFRTNTLAPTWFYIFKKRTSNADTNARAR